MRIEVTQQDIDMAARYRSRQDKFWPSNAYCPIACALKRSLVVNYAWVSIDYATCKGNRYWMPPAAEEFINTWDDYCAVKPFSFEAAEIEMVSA